MKTKIRKDIVTYKEFPKEELIRIVITKEGKTYISDTKEGRGIYVSQTSLKKGLDKGIIKKTISKYNGNIEDIQKELDKLI